MKYEESGHETSLLERCRNTFLSALLLNEKNYPTYVLTDWINGEWSIFLGTEKLAKNLLLNRPQAISEAVKWIAFPSRVGFLNAPYSPTQVADWVISQYGAAKPTSSPNAEYIKWLKSIIAQLAIETDALPTISYSKGKLTAWFHYRNHDLSSKQKPIELCKFSPPLPSGFEEDLRSTFRSSSDSDCSSQTYNLWTPVSLASNGWTIPAKIHSDLD